MAKVVFAHRIVNVLCLLFLLLNACGIEARHLNVMSPSNGLAVAVKDGFSDGFLDGLLLGAIKQSGPSPGDGHKFNSSEAMDHVAKEGPSVGAGHTFTDSGNMARVMDSGPSPGSGH